MPNPNEKTRDMADEGTPRLDMAVIPLRHIKDLHYASDQTDEEAMPLVVTNGPLPVARPITRLLRSCTWFSFKLCVGVHSSNFDLFESEQIKYPRAPLTNRTFSVGSAGEKMVLRFEATPYDPDNVLKRIEYESTVGGVRRLLYRMPLSS